MCDIKWNQNYNSKYSGYTAILGNILLRCEPEIRYRSHNGRKKRVVGWWCSVYSDKDRVVGCVRKLKKSSQKDAEKFATRYLIGGGCLILKQLKRAGLLEEVLSEVGIDL